MLDGNLYFLRQREREESNWESNSEKCSCCGNVPIISFSKGTFCSDCLKEARTDTEELCCMCDEQAEYKEDGDYYCRKHLLGTYT